MGLITDWKQAVPAESTFNYEGDVFTFDLSSAGLYNAYMHFLVDLKDQTILDEFIYVPCVGQVYMSLNFADIIEMFDPATASALGIVRG